MKSLKNNRTEHLQILANKDIVAIISEKMSNTSTPSNEKEILECGKEWANFDVFDELVNAVTNNEFP